MGIDLLRARGGLLASPKGPKFYQISGASVKGEKRAEIAHRRLA
jgi:hypothetical protein